VDDSVTGFIVPPKDPEALASAITKLLRDDKLRKEMGENAYGKMKEELSWDKIAEKTIEIYREVLNEHENREGNKWNEDTTNILNT
jgi:glycosyltransferase involved in cell wall biosynthesis